MLLNLLLAIIIDTFAQLREERLWWERLRRTRCFVCFLEGDDAAFDYHRRRVHNLWHYTYFLANLRAKYDEQGATTHFTGPELFVWKRLLNSALCCCCVLCCVVFVVVSALR